MNLLSKIYKKDKLEDIFTPNTIAKLTYINRSIVEKDLEKYLSLPGKQIIVYGHSGSGKTTLIRKSLNNKRQNFIKTHCESKTTFDDLLLQAFDDLNKFYIHEKNSNSQYSISAELKAEYAGLSSKVNETKNTSHEKKETRIVPIQLTPQKLAQFLGEINCVWLIEDFHKVAEIEKRRIADVVKIFIDTANDYKEVRIICIGAVATARELIELDNNLNNRVAELQVPLLSEDEISQIINKGFSLLNVNIDDSTKEKVVFYSNNLAAIAHQICFDLCFDSEIRSWSFFKRNIKTTSFKEAVNSYVRKNSDTFTKIYDTIIREPSGWNILKTFENSAKEMLSFNEIKNKIPKNKRIADEEMLTFLSQLQLPEYKEILRYDRSSQKYSLASPFFKAFLKMKFALEKTEHSNAIKTSDNRRNNKYSIDSSHTQDFNIDEDYFTSFNEILERLILESGAKSGRIRIKHTRRLK
ncbi:hypothetical protein ORI89_11905 [Sphingobacterium sp. UT-1RO-CII-1]|uniref:AAA family ATPase n=1 Tax=Sphingobacterium sp. UT-1RO-CII-1 TaxID=2995225 RepID=UPI00227B9A7F|nr:AAA family ATPase [Sphingobacterium sp. UT-1RO-CII-1]MCY4780358.1 hypothetical protein [Sphingobacterium sp. UT-1RO-CII-1]